MFEIHNQHAALVYF